MLAELSVAAVFVGSTITFYTAAADAKATLATFVVVGAGGADVVDAKFAARAVGFGATIGLLALSTEAEFSC